MSGARWEPQSTSPSPWRKAIETAHNGERHAYGFGQRLRDYWALGKSLQTGLLLFTGVAGFSSARCPVLSWSSLLALLGSLFFAVSGSTVLNMVYDRDIDARMKRTQGRPLPAGRLGAGEALALGLGLSAAGLIWAFSLTRTYGLVVLAGLFFDVVVYTIFLKRRTPWSILWGGIAGGMPALAGRVLAVGRIDLLGILLALAVLFWIPTHILTFSQKYAEDYRRAGVPVFPNTHGERLTRGIVAISTALAALIMIAVAVLLELKWGYLRALGALSFLLVVMAFTTVVRPSSSLNFRLFKFASLYMLGAMGLIALG